MNREERIRQFQDSLRKHLTHKEERKALNKRHYTVIDGILIFFCRKLTDRKRRIVYKKDVHTQYGRYAYAYSRRHPTKEDKTAFHVVACLRRVKEGPLLTSLLHELHHIYFERAIEECGIIFESRMFCSIIDAMEFDNDFMTEGELPNPDVFVILDNGERRDISLTFETALKHYMIYNLNS